MVGRAYITALLCVPLALPVNILFFLPMITGLWLGSARLFVNSSLPSFKNVYSCSLFVLAYCIALCNSLFSDTWSTISSRYVKRSFSFGRMSVSRLSLIRIYSFPHSFRILLSVLNMPYISLCLLSLPLHCHFLFALLRYPQTFSVHAHDIVLSYLSPRYNRHNHHSADNHGNLSGIPSRSFRSFLFCGHKARYFFCCRSCSEHPDIGLLQLTAFSAICKYIVMCLIRINDILLQ